MTGRSKGGIIRKTGPIRGKLPLAEGVAMRSARLMQCSLALLGLLVALPFATLAQTPASAWDPGSFAASFTLRTIAKGLESPLGIVDLGDGSGRLFIVEQTGKILLLKGGAVAPDPFLDISSLVSGGSEQGLLGLAVHPDFASNGTFVIDYTDVNGNTNIVRYQVDSSNPDIAYLDSAATLLYINQPFPCHSGGQVRFGSDGYLYIAMGDGGSQGDPNGNEQNTGALLGK